MSLISIPFTFTVGAVIVASQHNSCFSTIYSDYNGNIDNNNISASAAIADTKIAAITTAGKVSGAAFTSLSSIPSGAGVIPAANLTSVMPSGAIIIWSGATAAIPSGFVLCNGSNSTPDLRDRFIVGVGSTYAVGDTGGATTHNHGGKTGVQQNITSGTGFAVGAADKDHDHSISSASSLPPYYALCYIMKS